MSAAPGRACGRAVALALAAALVCACGCALFPFGGWPSGSPGGQDSPMGAGLKDWRVAFHCHSQLSHDSEVPFERIAAKAREQGFNAVILNDHYEDGNLAASPRGFLDGVLFIPGVETRGMGGSLMGFGPLSDYPKDLPPPDRARRFRAEGGLTAAGHCEKIARAGFDECELDAFEVYNLHAEFSALSEGFGGFCALSWRLLFLPIDCFFESAVTTPRANLEVWDQLWREGKPLAPLAGCDAHENIRIFGPLGGTLGTYPEILRLFSNHVLAPELSAAAILDAIRARHVFVVFDHLGDATGFALRYGKPGATAAILGDRAAFDPAAALTVELPSEASIRLYHDGAILREEAGRRLELAPLPGPGLYRVEVLLDERLWIAAAPIEVR